MEFEEDVIEQVLRLTDDPSYPSLFLAAEPISKEASSALGRLISDVEVSLVPGCPLLSFVSGTIFEPNWRKWCKPRNGSMFEMAVAAGASPDSGGTALFEFYLSCD